MTTLPSSSRVRAPLTWGWEDEDVSEAVKVATPLLRSFLGPPTPYYDNDDPTNASTLTTPAQSTRNSLPRLSACLHPPRFTLPAPLATFCTSDPIERLRCCYGQSYRDTVRKAMGKFDTPPDFVAFPTTEAQIITLLDFARNNSVSIMVYGGGTSVCGGVEPPSSPSISLNMKNFDQLLDVDSESMLVTMGAGTFGPQVNAYLQPLGFTLRHFPQSWEFSTLGGWVVTRAGGHYSTTRTHIDHFVNSLRVITPAGIVQTSSYPYSGAGPSPDSQFLGSEGVLGVVTAVTLKVEKTIVSKAFQNVTFPSFSQAHKAVKALVQLSLTPSVCRLLDEMEAMITGLSKKGKSTLILGWESPVENDQSLSVQLSRALKVCSAHGGYYPNHDPNAASAKDSRQATEERKGKDTKTETETETWRSNFLAMPYIRDHLAWNGYIVETFESCCTWADFEVLHREVKKAVIAAINSYGGKGLVTCRFTHVYPDGPAPYFTVFASGHAHQHLAQWDLIKKAASDALLKYGGTITHHHAVGRDHSPHFMKEKNPLYLDSLRALKGFYDADNVLNPGVLLSSKL
eukprot:TRINITY_DN12362_c0_g1_i1.p1 TRINITY_DN12362_c0_g1~~TRINITY_DN12362_c0_g1_i1.p1  ORF type:complete len:587 (-),score=92.44 TRINITY_DN12362_c0_g1_i1:172-1884(-)